MKLKYKTLIFLLTLSMALWAQQYEDEQTINLSVDQLKSLHIYNMEGGVEVRGVDGNIATLKIKRTIKTSSIDKMEMAKKEIYIDSLRDNGNMYYFIEGPSMNFQVDDDGNGSYNNWNLAQSKSELRHFKISYAFKWEVRIPKHLMIHVYNHKEPLTVTDMQNKVVVRNHHDGVTLKGMHGDVNASSHHGDVVVSFDRNPPNELICDSHHGDIKIYAKDGFSGDVSMKSHHGAFYTDFEGKNLPPVVKVSKKDGRKTRYKLGESSRYQIGSGGPHLEFRTHHGDVSVRKS